MTRNYWRTGSAWSTKSVEGNRNYRGSESIQFQGTRSESDRRITSNRVSAATLEDYSGYVPLHFREKKTRATYTVVTKSPSLSGRGIKPIPLRPVSARTRHGRNFATVFYVVACESSACVYPLTLKKTKRKSALSALKANQSIASGGYRLVTEKKIFFLSRVMQMLRPR